MGRIKTVVSITLQVVLYFYFAAVFRLVLDYSKELLSLPTLVLLFDCR